MRMTARIRWGIHFLAESAKSGDECILERGLVDTKIKQLNAGRSQLLPNCLRSILGIPCHHIKAVSEALYIGNVRLLFMIPEIIFGLPQLIRPDPQSLHLQT